MIENIPAWISPFFLLITIISLAIFYYSNGKPTKLIIALAIYSIVQSLIAYSGFYQNSMTTPPRLLMVLIPTFIMIIYGTRPKQLSWVLSNRNTYISTLLHTIRIPMEIILFQLFTYKMIPELMTYEGRNYDIIIGITAPIIAFLFYKNYIGKRVLLIWNIVGLGFILFIFINATLAVNSVIQQFGFDNPNRAILYFPFILLASTVVPLVVYTHITDIIKLRRAISLLDN